MRLSGRVVWICITGICISVLVALLQRCSTPDKKKEVAAPKTDLNANYVGSATCQSCHAGEYSDWKKSDHFLAMQEARDSTVLGDFNNAKFNADGITSRFFKQEGKFMLNTQGDDGKYHDYQVLYTFGRFPLQQYLIAFPGGRLQPTRVSWNSRDKKWFHQYAGQKIDPHDWIHWTGNGQNWNTMCASCHSTNLQKNYDFDKDTYQTSWDEINVTCESCHGPGSKHVTFLKSDDYASGKRLQNSGLLYAHDTIPQQQLNTCASCHSRKSDIAQAMIPSKELLDNMIPQVISNEFYFPDGQINQEDYEYGSFSQSKMFHQGIRCSNCHNPHSGKLVKQGNDLCMNCHKPAYNTTAHHFHTVNTEGAQCINCHMTAKTYMGNDVRRDHSFRIPRPDQSLVYGTPNACTGCHQGKTPEWAAGIVKNKFGAKRAYHFSDDLLPGSQLTDKSEKHLVKLLADTLQPEIARATAAFYLGNLASEKSGEVLVSAVNDGKAMVRYYSLRSLENFNPAVWRDRVHTALRDPVRAVRLAAADLYHRLPVQSIPSVAKSDYSKADAENRQYLRYQTDFAVGNVMLGDYELQGGDHVNAIVHYVRGLKKDSLMNYARLNLSAAYNSVGKNPEALEMLEKAAAIDPSNDRIYYSLGLLHYELGNIPAAASDFQTSIKLGSTDTGLYYNYGLLLQQQGKAGDAERVLLRGFSLDPQASNINFALAYVYVQQGLSLKAKKHAEVLRKKDPNNPEYQALFRSLGI